MKWVGINTLFGGIESDGTSGSNSLSKSSRIINKINKLYINTIFI